MAIRWSLCFIILLLLKKWHLNKLWIELIKVWPNPKRVKEKRNQRNSKKKPDLFKMCILLSDWLEMKCVCSWSLNLILCSAKWVSQSWNIHCNAMKTRFFSSKFHIFPHHSFFVCWNLQKWCELIQKPKKKKKIEVEWKSVEYHTHTTK